MKRNILLTVICALTFTGIQAQTQQLPQDITLKNGQTVRFIQDEIDSARIVLTPDNDTLGIKVYCKGKESRDFLARKSHRGHGIRTTPPILPLLPTRIYRSHKTTIGTAAPS